MLLIGIKFIFKIRLSECNLVIIFLNLLNTTRPIILFSPIVTQKQWHPENIGSLIHSHSKWFEWIISLQVHCSKRELRRIRDGRIFGKSTRGSKFSGFNVYNYFCGVVSWSYYKISIFHFFSNSTTLPGQFLFTPKIHQSTFLNILDSPVFLFSLHIPCPFEIIFSFF